MIGSLTFAVLCYNLLRPAAKSQYHTEASSAIPLYQQSPSVLLYHHFISPNNGPNLLRRATAGTSFPVTEHASQCGKKYSRSVQRCTLLDHCQNLWSSPSTRLQSEGSPLTQASQQGGQNRARLGGMTEAGQAGTRCYPLP